MTTDYERMLSVIDSNDTTKKDQFKGYLKRRIEMSSQTAEAFEKALKK